MYKHTHAQLVIVHVTVTFGEQLRSRRV